MATVTLYHNPRCSKSRQTLELLRENGIEPEIILYLETPPSTAELKILLNKLGLGPRDILRTGEEAYKALNLSDTGLSDADLIEAIVSHPKLLQRPIAVHCERAVIGRPPENVLALVGE